MSARRAPAFSVGEENQAVLLTTLYKDADPTRWNEFLECIRRNLQCRQFSEIHVFVEQPLGSHELLAAYPLLGDVRIKLIPHRQRATYHDLFIHANCSFPGRHVVIANADIFFDQSLARLRDCDLAGKLLCLSRWDVQPDGSSRFFEHAASQDSWIFQAPIREFRCDFQFGLPGCDNRLAWEAEQSGLKLSNPSRTLRGYHLHLSRVRRYKERHRLSGPTQTVPASFLGTPWLWFVVPCRGRLDDLRQTMEFLIAQPNSSCVLVDFSCPDEAGNWARKHFPNAFVASVAGQKRFHAAEARNRGAAAVDDDGLICFLDADMCTAPGLSDYVLTHFEDNTFMVPDRPGPGFDTALICRKADFDRVRGFDEAFLDWGEECADLRARFRRSNLTERHFADSFLSPLGHHGQSARNLGAVHDREITRSIHTAYRRVKSSILDETGGGFLSLAASREIYSAIVRSQMTACGLTPDSVRAAIAFRETMGYTIAVLEAGVSSHNNESRPFVAIPEPLMGLAFTQVVACAVSTIDVEFLTGGKLYVLVGTDWEGLHTARRWLDKRGFRENIPDVETRRGTAFEVWSIVGDAGERVAVPTQVMLAADCLVRK